MDNTRTNLLDLKPEEYESLNTEAAFAKFNAAKRPKPSALDVQRDIEAEGQRAAIYHGRHP